ncbi:MAG: hypothetical protein FJX29_04035, partial [Alphaproteobacteria bacterium]|nr:hypothetical protein [Alphaproteobacteria bacterium]
MPSAASRPATAIVTMATSQPTIHKDALNREGAGWITGVPSFGLVFAGPAVWLNRRFWPGAPVQAAPRIRWRAPAWQWRSRGGTGPCRKMLRGLNNRPSGCGPEHGRRKQAMPSLRVAHTQEIAEGIRLFELRDPGGAALAPFEPGGHVEVCTPSGEWRKYSLCNDPAETERYVIAVKREENGRGGSRSMCDSLREGAMIEIREPRNDFKLVKSHGGYVFIAGGIGITPIMAMMRALLGEGQGAFRLIYLSRSPATAAFLDELKAPEF